MPETETSTLMADRLNSYRITRSFKAVWGIRRSLQVVATGFVIIVGLTLLASFEPRVKQALGLTEECRVPAIYNFGDSNSDTGSVSSAFHQIPYPNGITFFGRPNGRYCDGRLMIDFITEKLGLPYLSSFLDSLEGNFQHGADFAAGGSSIQIVNGKLFETGINPLSLYIQVSQFEQLKQRTRDLHEQASSFDIKRRLPKLEDFSKALYTLDIGQNDLYNAFRTTTEEQTLKLIPKLINQFSVAVERLYQLGARKFWIHNTGPIGCLPYALMKFHPKPENLDETGCLKSLNMVAQEFNRQLKDRIDQLRVQLHDSLLVYVDVYNAKYSLISNSEQNGFVDPLGYCCKHVINSYVPCSRVDIVNGTVVFATPCNNPGKYISWDSIHYSEAANRWIANRISDGSFSDPPIPITRLCQKSSPT